MPIMMMGSATTFIDCDECWKLLLVTRNKSLYLWDLFDKTYLHHDSLASLLASSPNSSAKDVGTIYYLHMFWIGQLCFYENFSYALVSIIFYIFFSGTIKVIYAKLSKYGSILLSFLPLVMLSYLT